MTQEQAQQLQTALNNANSAAGLGDRIAVLLKMYSTSLFTETWKAFNIPLIYEAQYNLANYDQQVAFARVGVPLQVSEDYLNQFNAAAANDAVLAEYLNL